jgi:heparanase 1
MTRYLAPGLAATMAGGMMIGAVALSAQSGGLNPAGMPRIGQVDERFVSYNVEMVEVTGGRFWKPYKSAPATTEPAVSAPAAPASAEPATDKPASDKPSGPAMDASAFRMRPPLDLANARLRTLAAALGPAYVRVSGTWANSTYFHDSDAPAPSAPPTGFGGVLTRAQWRGVVEFAKAVDAKVVTSFAISPGVRDQNGQWTPAQLQSLLAYTSSIGGSIAAAEFFNEPNVAAVGGAPKGYDAAAYGRDIRAFLPFIRKAAPDMRILGPGAVGEGGLLANYPAGLKSDALLTAAGPGVDVFSYHHYPGVSQRCAGRGGSTSSSANNSASGSAAGGTTPENALSEDWLSRAEKDARFYAALRDRFEPGKPLWLTESGETGCGGNPWASTFTDTFRYVEQLGRLAKLGVQVVMHNTLSASDYALIDEETLDPRPSYWAAILWRRLMGTTVLDAGPSPAPGVHVFAHCLAGKPGGVALVAVNTDRGASREVILPIGAERYTLSSSTGLLSHRVELNGKELGLAKDGAVPVLRGIAAPAGQVSLPAASITFLAVTDAGHAACSTAQKIR